MKKILNLSLLVAAIATTSAVAQYPEKPITLIVPFAPGGVADLTARVTANSLEKVLGQPMSSTTGQGLEAASAPQLRHARRPMVAHGTS